MKLFMAMLLLATPLVVLEYWLLGAFGGFRLTQKLPEKLKRILGICGWIAFLSGGAALGIASMHGCGFGGMQLAPRLADTSSQWRPLPPLVYIQPDAKSVVPTPAVAPVAEITDVWTESPITSSSSTGTVTSATTATTATAGTMTWSAVTSGTTIWTTNGSYTVSTFIDPQGNQVQTVTDGQGNLISRTTTSQFTITGGSAIPDSRMARMKSYPASERPSNCFASCMSHHRSWVTPVENSYCDQDTSNQDGGFYGWVKQGATWKPTVWPATEDSDERAPKMIRLKDGEQISLTEGKRIY